MTQEKLHVTVPQNVMKMMDELCEETNLKRSSIVTVALTEYYKKNKPHKEAKPAKA